MTLTITPAALAERYIAMWNEADSGRRAEIIAGVWSLDGVFVDPTFEVSGHDGLSAMVDTAQQMFPGHSFRPVGDVDTHHNRLRWSWELAADGQPAVAGGTDVVTLDADGKIREVVGFINFAPAH
ncbi:MAG TPA: nuclear transport factor 2 family protein [Kribbella sp.]|nr:nuclear transport factor 2 family protein [Kribbella sp.]